VLNYFVLTPALILAFSPEEKELPATLSADPMIVQPTQRPVFQRRGERQSPLLGGEGGVRTVVKPTFDGHGKDGHVQGAGEWRGDESWRSSCAR